MPLQKLTFWSPLALKKILVELCVCMYDCVYVCMYVCMYVRMYVYMYECTTSMPKVVTEREVDVGKGKCNKNFLKS